jgi:flagellar FliJ protein
MAFRFGLNTVLKHRKRLEDVAQREFSEAQDAVDRCLNEIESMYRRIDEVRGEIAQLEKVGQPESLAEIQGMQNFIGGQKVRIERLRLQARELLQVAEEKHEALIAAAREKKILVKLKEKRFAEYKAWLQRVEAKELDDLTMVRTASRPRMARGKL